MEEVGRREEGEEEDLFKASLNGEGEVFLASLEYMADGMVIVSENAVRENSIYIALYRGLSATPASGMASRSIVFLSGLRPSAITIRSLVLKFG